MAAKRFLVTGGLGFLGAALVQALVHAGYSVRVLDNASRGSIERLGAVQNHVEIISGDIRDATIVARAMQEMDSVCHLAFVNGTHWFYEKPVYVLDVGVKGMVNVLNSAIRAGVPELIIASSSEVYQTPPRIPTDETVPLSIPDPRNPRYSYAGGKIISELMALHYGREYFQRVLIFRPHNVFGPNMGFDHVIPETVWRMVQLKAKYGSYDIPFPIQGTGDQSRTFIFIKDFTAGLMLVIEKGEHLNIYNIGTTEELKIGDVVQRIAQCMGVSMKVIAGPPAAGNTQRRCPDIRKIRQLGFEPRFKFDTALPPTVQWYLEHPADSAGISVKDIIEVF